MPRPRKPDSGKPRGSRPLRYGVLIKRSAEKEMRGLPAAVIKRVVKVILALESNPQPRGVRQLRGTDNYRLRVGDYRILYDVDDRARKVTIFAVGHRREVYRGL